MPTPRWVGPALALGLWALGFAIKIPVLGSPPYWDEGLHYWTAKHLGDGYDAITDVYGNPVAAPQALVFQRPLFYLAFWLPAQGGFEAFRVTHAVAASLLSPLAYLLLRGHGVRRPFAAAAGVAVAVVPQLAMWGALGLMDSLMTAAIAVMLWARATHRSGVLFAASVAAVWTKETAYAAVVGLLAYDAVRGWIAGRVGLAPLRLDGRTSALAWAALVAPWPLVYAVMQDLAMPGAANHGSALPVLDRMFTTPWLLPILVLGLWPRRSRSLCAFALAAGLFLLALQLASRDVPQWYEVPTAFFALAGAGAAADAWWREAPRRVRWSTPAPAAVAVLLVYLLVMLPNSPERDRLRPFSGDGGNSLAGSWAFEMDIRDRELHDAIAAIPLHERPDVVDVDVAVPAMFVPIVEQARDVYFDSSFVRTLVDVDLQALAGRIESNATWTILDRSDYPLAKALDETYADCVRFQNAGFTVFEAAGCAGRGERLEDAWRAHDPRF